MAPEFAFPPIGIIHSCFKEKFGIPRQAGLVSRASASLEVLPPYDREEAFRGLEEFSHIWVTFVFHASIREHWKPTVRPPRLGGNRQVGVFASRSPFRPNPLGLSAVALTGMRRERGRLLLELEGGDFLDQTPVLDIKPYLPYADCIEHAHGGYAAEAPSVHHQVCFSAQALEACRRHEQRLGVDLQGFIRQLLAYDPRPAYKSSASNEHTFAMKLFDFDLKWQIEGDRVQVVELRGLTKGQA
ncbi:MAG: tRNA (N6-threonylcarbamoyladenosine(37)-N6)-methyltransferase TrmO [Gammaproteobacteria bacterium]